MSAATAANVYGTLHRWLCAPHTFALSLPNSSMEIGIIIRHYPQISEDGGPEK